MELTLLERGPEAVSAGYACPCGCTPSVEFARGAELVEDGCCCGNHFAVGPRAAASLAPKAGFRPELQRFDAPWGERLEAAWLIGPSVHGPEAGHDHDGDHGHEHGHEPTHAHSDAHEHDGAHPDAAIDPVCGMTVERDAARARGLHTSHAGTDYFFCGKGCLLEFRDDPERFLDPAYVPSM